MLLLSLSEFSPVSDREGRDIPTQFKVIAWVFEIKEIADDGKNRRVIYQNMMNVGSYLESVEYHVVYLNSFKYSVISREAMEKGEFENCKSFLKKIDWIV